MTTKGQEIWISSNDSILTYHSENHAITFKCKITYYASLCQCYFSRQKRTMLDRNLKGLYLYEETKPLQKAF